MEQVIREYVRQFEKEYEGDSKYKRYLGEMSGINLKVITEDDIKRVIQPFLYKWGRMQRAAFKKRAGDWQMKLAKQIQANFEQLRDFKTRDLRYTILDEFKSPIRQCYESLYKVIGKIGAAKVLHLICSDFFPVWDNPIANAILEEDIKFGMQGQVAKIPAYRQRDYQKFMKQMQDPAKMQKFIKKVQRERKGEFRKSPSAEYYSFMQATQNFIKRYESVLSDLATKYDKGILKISDECFWWATHRSLSLFF